MSSVARVKVINRKTVFGSNPTYLVIQFEDGRFEKIDVLPNRREAIPEIGTYLFITYTEGSPIVVHSYSSQAPP